MQSSRIHTTIQTTQSYMNLRFKCKVLVYIPPFKQRKSYMNLRFKCKVLVYRVRLFRIWLRSVLAPLSLYIAIHECSGACILRICDLIRVLFRVKCVVDFYIAIRVVLYRVWKLLIVFSVQVFTDDIVDESIFLLYKIVWGGSIC